jgi:hypothetical protein
MSTFVYSPGVRMHVETTHGDILDLTEDLVSGQIILRENAPHTTSFVLQNAQRKYDGRFAPMDKISVQLKRLNWMQTMTGFLNDPPIFQAFPGALSMSATCTLKKPQFFPVDTTTGAFQSMVLAAMGKNIDERAVMGDNGLSRLVVDAMTQVLHWPRDQIHIGQVPRDWFKFAQKVSDLIAADQALYEAIGASFTAAGDYNGVITLLQPGTYGGYTVNKIQARNASVIYSTVRSMGQAGDAVAVMSLMAAIDESQLYNLGSRNVTGSAALADKDASGDPMMGGDSDSVGVFQQRPSQNWGPLAKCMDVVSATKTFVTRLLPKLPGARSSSHSPDVINPSLYGMTIQSVQVSATADGSNYQRYLGAAQGIVAELNKLSSAVGGARIQGQPITGPAAGFKATGSQVAKVGIDLINAHKTHPIRYDQSRSDPNLYRTPLDQVTYLDCSSLVDVIYFNATGKGLPTANGNVATIRETCILIPLEAAANIQGAVLIKDTEHIGLSLGNGTTHVAAHMAYADVTKDVDISPIAGNGFTTGGLLPGVDYSSSATTVAAQNALSAAGVKPKGLAPQLTDVNDPSTTNATADGSVGSPFESLVNTIIVNANENSSLIGNAIGGYATLINDQPFLPWLQAVINASMRSFCSAPNGDFIAWFPDYFGAWGTAGIMKIENIELQNFAVKWSDQTMVTHQFVLGNLGATLLDPATGNIGTNSPVNDLLSLATGTAGIASLDFPEIFNILYGETAPSSFAKQFLERFGARIDVQQMPNVQHGSAEFFMALYLFMQRWAGQFSAVVPLTFMPELFPGMLVQIDHYGFQAYVRGVTHSFSFGPSGRFTTDIDICAPTNLGKASRTDMLSLLPLASNKAH